MLDNECVAKCVCVCVCEIRRKCMRGVILRRNPLYDVDRQTSLTIVPPYRDDRTSCPALCHNAALRASMHHNAGWGRVRRMAGHEATTELPLAPAIRPDPSTPAQVLHQHEAEQLVHVCMLAGEAAGPLMRPSRMRGCTPQYNGAPTSWITFIMRMLRFEHC